MEPTVIKKQIFGFVLGFAWLLLLAPAWSAELTQTDLANWAYHWGDVPIVDGKPALRPEKDWTSIRYPMNPPERQDETTVWFKASLPEMQLKQPVLFVHSIDLVAQIYFDGQLLYQHGDLAGKDKGKFIGWPWHAIELPDNFSGEPIYFRVYSDYTDIGLWGEVKLFDKVDLLYYLIDNSYAEVLVALFCIFVSLLAFAFALLRKQHRYFLLLGAFSLTSALTMLAENHLVQFVFNYPLVRVYLAAVTYFAMPVFMAFLLAEWLDGRERVQLRWLGSLHSVYLLGAMAVSLSGWTTVAHTFPVFDVLLALSLAFMLYICVRKLRQVSIERLLVMTTFAVFGLLLLVDMAVAHSILPWSRVNVSIGPLCFSAALVLISLRHYHQIQHALHKMNEQLEEKVQQRTIELEAYARAEKNRAIELEQINTFNGRLEDLNSRLQACHDLAHAQQLLDAELAMVFKPLRVYVVTRPALGFPVNDALCQLTVQEINGNSSLFAIVLLAESTDRHLLAEPVLKSFIERVVQRLSASLSNIKLYEELHRFSFEDALTGLRNRRFFDEALSHGISLAQQHGTTLSLLICDIDHFKQFNDVYGHEAGDTALQNVADVLRRQFRETDIPCRYGGEEFVVLLRGAGVDIARTKAQLLHSAIEKCQIRYQNEMIGPLTVSIGVASWSLDMDADTLLRQADIALYQAKQAGRNRVKIFDNDAD